jgi:hypothetical protein
MVNRLSVCCGFDTDWNQCLWIAFNKLEHVAFYYNDRVNPAFAADHPGGCYRKMLHSLNFSVY